jgi:hypothetical protein
MPDKAPLPFAWGVLYAHPNKDGSMKSCRNCYAWVAGENKCVIHPRDVKVTSVQVCGYHIPGEPLKEWMDIPGLESVDPSLSGLARVGEGTVCGSCTYFEKTSEAGGLCHAVASKNGKPPQPVEEMGCCARWEQAF